MSPETLRAMIKSLPDVTEDGGNVRFDSSWEVTVHAVRGSAALSITHVESLRIGDGFVVLETSKHQRIVLALEDVRGLAAEPSRTDKGGRRTGFV